LAVGEGGLYAGSVVDWQIFAVVAIQVLAVGYLARRFFGKPSGSPKRASGPDVAVSALVRKKAVRRP
jgi:hypothetical protein